MPGKTNVLDSFALLAYLGAEPGSERVVAVLREAEAGATRAVMNEINLGEVYYVVARARAEADAEDVLSRFETLPIERVPNAFDDVIAAARIKARFPVSYADAFAVATAGKHEATVLTGDPEFRAVSEQVPVEWIR